MVEISSLSIVLCTFNRSILLRETLERFNSLQAAEGVRVDIVVVNNNSTDDTHEVCAHFADSAILPVTYCLETTQGLSHARNCGLRQANGDVVLFTDDDIVVPDAWVRNYVSAYRRHGADAVFGKIAPEWNGERPGWFHKRLGPIYGMLDYGDLEIVGCNRRQEFFGANFAVRRRLLVEMGGFDPSLGRTPDSLYISEERKVFLRLVEEGRKIVYDPAIQVRHRISNGMKTRKYVRKYYRDTAVSLVNMGSRESKRKLFGIPYFRAVECLLSLLLFAPRCVQAVLRRDIKAVFPLRLELARSFRVCRLHVQRWLTAGTKDSFI